jgi:alpha-tubulin suppressor-like RCC1 family protein
VAGGHAWAYIGADGLSSCGLRVDGVAMCWGNDFNGELGQGTVGLGRTVPTEVVGGIAFMHMDVGHGTVCATTGSGDTYCWGSGFWGERGDGTFAPQQATPVKVVTP